MCPNLYFRYKILLYITAIFFFITFELAHVQILKFLSKSSKILVLGLIYQNLDFK